MSNDGSTNGSVYPVKLDEGRDYLVNSEQCDMFYKHSVDGNETFCEEQARTLRGNHQCFIDTYFSTHESMYFTGDGVRRDVDGYFCLTRQLDDVLNVSAHRLGTVEIESALIEGRLKR